MHVYVPVCMCTNNRYEQALDLHAQLEPESPAHARTLNNLGNLLADRGESSAALAALRHALEIHTVTAGPASAEAGSCLSNIGTVLHEKGDLSQARACFQRALAIAERRDPNSKEAAMALGNLANVLDAIGQFDEVLMHGQACAVSASWEALLTWDEWIGIWSYLC